MVVLTELYKAQSNLKTQYPIPNTIRLQQKGGDYNKNKPIYLSHWPL
jgi:hypothetical protein